MGNWPWLEIASGLLALMGVSGLLASVWIRRRSRDRNTPLGWMGLVLLNAGVGCFCLGLLGGLQAMRERVARQHVEREAARWLALLTEGTKRERQQACAWIGAADYRPGARDLIAALEDPESDVRLAALWALARIGPDTPAQTEALALLLASDEADADLRELAGDALAAWGADAVGDLDQALRSPREELARGAALALWRIEPEGHARMLEALGSSRAMDRYVAAMSVATIGSAPAGAAGVLQARLEDSNPRVRWVTCAALWKAGLAEDAAQLWERATSETFPHWLAALDDPDPVLRRTAEMLAEGARTNRVGFTLAMRRALRDPGTAHAVLRHQETLGGFGEAPPVELVALLKRSDAHEPAWKLLKGYVQDIRRRAWDAEGLRAAAIDADNLDWMAAAGRDWETVQRLGKPLVAPLEQLQGDATATDYARDSATELLNRLYDALKPLTR